MWIEFALVALVAQSAHDSRNVLGEPPPSSTRQGPVDTLVATGHRFTRSVTEPGLILDTATRTAQAYLEAERLPLGLRELELIPGPERRTRLGTWVPFALAVQGVPVLDRQVLVHVDERGQLDRVSAHLPVTAVDARWLLDARGALLAAVRHTHALVIADPSVERNPGTVAHAWFDDGIRLRPVFVVYPRSLHPLQRPELIIDARDGRALRETNRVRLAADFACARVFTPTPGAELNDGDAQQTLLPFATPDDDGYLRGSYFQTFNCCRQVDCDPDGPDSRVQGNISNPIGFGADPIYYDIVSCSEHPKARASDGYFLFDPVDPAPGAANYDDALEDPFAEPAIYFNAQNLFSYLRQVGNPDLQLRAHGGTPQAPAAPFHLTANLVVPDFEQAYTQIAPWPLGQGRGAADNPVVINDYMRIANAAYIPASTPGTQPLPIDIFDRDYDSVVMFQGDDRDFGYDGDIVYHEMTHAVIGSTTDLVFATLDEQGSLMSPGSLNEGYADYFAASLSNDSVTGEYGGHVAGEEGGIRDADNDRICPDDLTGEVHDDSWPWSGALWELRNVFVGETCDRDRFDAAVFDGLMGLPPDATYDQASEATALALAQAYGRESGAYQIAHCVFERRGMLGCERVLQVLAVDASGASVSKPVNLLYVSGSGDIGVNEAPSQTQLRVDLPKGSTDLTLTWAEGSGGTDAFFGSTPAFEVLLKRGSPIRYQRSAGAVTHDADERLPVTRTGGGIGQPSQVQPVVVTVDEACGATYFVAFINGGGTATITNVRARATIDAELASACDGDLDVLPDPSRPEPAACAAMPSSVSDSEQCDLSPPHGIEACPDKPGPPPPTPEPRDGCDCRSSARHPGSLALLGLLLGLHRRRR
ncbi:MAG: hypothetical protein ABIJ09_01170 [Pseudomonadota bacterium]